MIWGGNLTAQQAFFLRYADTETNAHALQVWRSGESAQAGEGPVYRLGIGRGANERYDIAWLGLGADAALETVTDVTVYLPDRAAEGAVLHYTTRAADGTEQEHAVPAQELYSAPADGGAWLEIPADAPLVGDMIRLAEE